MVTFAESFPAFPFTPYSIQLDFMRELYALLEHGGIGLFESPTGVAFLRASATVHKAVLVTC